MRKLRHSEIRRVPISQIQQISRYPITVVLEDVRSIYNVGSIFRTSDAARIEELALTGITGTPENPSLRKTALGAEEVVPWSRCANALDAVDRFRQRGYTICVLEITDTPTPIEEISGDHFPLCLVIGNEVHGISEELVSAADLALEIPQYGIKQSLNVSVAYGICVMRLVEQYLRAQG